MIPAIRQTPLRPTLLAVAVAVCGVLILLFNSVTPVEARIRSGLDLDPDNAYPAGIWGNSDTIWVANDAGSGGNKIYAYHRSDGSRDPSKDFNTLHAAGNRAPRGIWSDGTTMFVVDHEDLKVYAYKMSDRNRNFGEDFALNLDTVHVISQRDHVPNGIWGNDTTIWVANNGETTLNKIYAYKRSDGSRDPGKDFNTLWNAAQADINGLWSDGTTMWGIYDDENRAYAYKMVDDPNTQGTNEFTQRDPSKDIELPDLKTRLGKAGGGAWSDGVTLYVTYNLHNSYLNINKVLTSGSVTLSV